MIHTDGVPTIAHHPGVVNARIAKIFEDAALTLKENTWYQGQPPRHTKNRYYCYATALSAQPEMGDLEHLVHPVVKRELGVGNLLEVFAWNDNLPTKSGKRTVVRSLQRTARRIREGKLRVVTV